jgi:hypothetical protein
MSVDSDFRMTVIEAQDLRLGSQGAHERRLNGTRTRQRQSAIGMAPDSPNLPDFHADQSKTAQGDRFIQTARPISPVGPEAASLL